MSNIIATDVPSWLTKVINKIQWNNIGGIMTNIATQIVVTECRRLPQKQKDYSVNSFATFAPAKIIETVNLVNFNLMSPESLSQFQNKIETNVQQYLGVTL